MPVPQAFISPTKLVPPPGGTVFLSCGNAQTSYFSTVTLIGCVAFDISQIAITSGRSGSPSLSFKIALQLLEGGDKEFMSIGIIPFLSLSKKVMVTTFMTNGP